jgi:hypothetical protein
VPSALIVVPVIRRSAFVVLAALAVTACGGGRADSSVSYGHGDAATFTIDGRSINVTESGRASVQIQGAPELAYHGPVGCAGRYFTADFVDGVPMFFRYGSQDAYLLVGSDEYYFGGAPDHSGGRLSWNTTDNNHQIDIQVNCPPPPHTPSLVASTTPRACDVLTSAIARTTVGEKVGAARFVRENPDLTYCEYASLDKTSNGNRRVSASVTTPAELEQLSSWQAPPIPGLGAEAHGGQAADGLAVRSDRLGLELTVDLGFNATNAQNLAAEEQLARVLLARLR